MEVKKEFKFNNDINKNIKFENKDKFKENTGNFKLHKLEIYNIEKYDRKQIYQIKNAIMNVNINNINLSNYYNSI